MRYVALWLAGIVVAVYFMQWQFSTDHFVLVKSLKFSEPWRLLASVFAHGSPVHLLNNLFALVLFGLMLEGRVGHKRVLVLFLVVGLLVNVFSPYDRSLGASGAVYGIMGALVALRPKMTFYVSYFPMPMAVAALLWIGQDVLGLFYPSQVAHVAHLSGLFMGLAIGILWRREFGDPLFAKSEPKKDPLLEKQLDEWEDRYMKR